MLYALCKKDKITLVKTTFGQFLSRLAHHAQHAFALPLLCKAEQHYPCNIIFLYAAKAFGTEYCSRRAWLFAQT